MIHLFKQIHQHLQKTRQVLIITHQNPDADTLGSASAMAEYLEKQNIPWTIFCLSPVPPNLRFLKHADKVVSETDTLNDQTIDTVVILDCGDPHYAGLNKKTLNKQAVIINIDHHQTNERYGHINLVNPSASATAEILYGFFSANNIRPSSYQATALLAGIITDTGNFSNAATSSSAINVSGHLLRLGANLPLINKWTVRNTSVDILKLWGVVLERLQHNKAKDLAYTYATNQDYAEFNMEEKDIDGLANFMNNIGESVKISLFIKETTNGKIKGSFRTTHDDVDVSYLAKKLGGGGHKKAAGFVLEGSVQDILNKVLTMEQ